MFEKLMAGLAGFIVAYLVVKAIRSFRSLNMVILIGLMTIEVRSELIVNYTNRSAVAMIAEWYSSVGATSNYWQAVTLQPGQGTRLNNPNASYDPYGFWWKTYSNNHYERWAGPWSYDGTFYEYWDGGQTNTPYYWACPVIHNDDNLGKIYNFYLWVNGELVYVGDQYIPAGGTWNVPCITNSTPFNWTAKPLYNPLEQNQEPDQGGNGFTNIMINPPSQPVPDGPGDIAYTNTIPNIPIMEVDTNLPPGVNDRMDMAWLIDAISKLFAGQNKLLSNGMSPQIDYTPWWQNQSNQMNIANTNLTLINSNTTPATTGQLAGLWTEYYAAEQQAGLADGSNLLQQSGMNGMTNSTWGSGPASVDGSGSPELFFTLGTVGGVPHAIYFDIAHWMANQLTSDAWKITGWVQTWLAWLINLGLWVAIMWRMDELLKEASDAKNSPRLKINRGTTIWGALGGMAFQWAVTTAIVAAIIAMPTVLVTWLASHGVASPLTGNTPLQDVANNTMDVSTLFLKMLRHWTNQLIHVIPYATCIAAILNYLGFLVFSRSVVEGCKAVLWRWGNLIPIIVFLALDLEVQAAQVKVENLSDREIGISNANQVLYIPKGIVSLENVDAGEWQSAGNTITVPNDGKLVVRVTVKRSDGTVNYENGLEYSTEDWFMLGMKYGFAIFGSAWAVSAMWQGWKLRHGGES